MRKIAIIGAGINGLYLAQKLAKKNENVCVFERKSEIGKTACSGLFSEKILKYIPESEKLIENKINFVLIHFPKKILKINFKSDFLVINHFKLDNLVADLAEKSGVNIYLDQEKIDIEKKISDFDLLIGSDGANSSVRKLLNISNKKFFLGIQGFVKETENSSHVDAWPTKNGFIWKIPRKNQTEWGIMEKPDKAKNIFDNFLKEKNIFLEDIRSSLIPQDFLGFYPFKNKKITLCGDAAGLVKPWSGGGVIWGLIGADLLLKNFPDFLKYYKALKKFFLIKIIFSRIAVKIVYFFGFNFPWLMPKNFKINNDFLI